MKLKKTPQNYRRVGIIGAAVVALLAGLIAATSTFPFGQDTYFAELEHSAGLRVGEEVQVAGVGVGEVRKIELKDRKVRVEFTVDSDIDLGRETTAEVKVATLLGTHFLLVSPLGGGDLADDTVPLAQTRVPYNLQDVINETGSLADDLDVDLISQALSEVANTMDVTSEEFLPALQGVSDLSKVLASRSTEIGELLESTSTFSGQLAESTGDITVLMKQSNVLLANLLQRRDDIHALLVDLRSVGAELSSLMAENRGKVGPMLDSINGTIKVLTTNHKTLGDVADLLGPMARYLANSTGNGSWLDQYMPEATPDGLRCLQEGNCA
ncbi:MCE family protein [Nocardioides sp. Bht2]|uniref:MCE family protein n=1 Tax=Nocardioides sp. Bht2 TaxID=3392297 RepID=UPI0039B5E7B8